MKVCRLYHFILYCGLLALLQAVLANKAEDKAIAEEARKLSIRTADHTSFANVISSAPSATPAIRKRSSRQKRVPKKKASSARMQPLHMLRGAPRAVIGLPGKVREKWQTALTLEQQQKLGFGIGLGAATMSGALLIQASRTKARGCPRGVVQHHDPRRSKSDGVSTTPTPSSDTRALPKIVVDKLPSTPAKLSPSALRPAPSSSCLRDLDHTKENGADRPRPCVRFARRCNFVSYTACSSRASSRASSPGAPSSQYKFVPPVTSSYDEAS